MSEEKFLGSIVTIKRDDIPAMLALTNASPATTAANATS